MYRRKLRTGASGTLHFKREWLAKDLFEALREADSRFYAERDRRYSEVSVEREKALKIKETSELRALSLAREIQDYKDEKANNLRDQITSERGSYITKPELDSSLREIKASIDPLKTWITNSTGRNYGREQIWGYIVGALGITAIIWNTFLHH